MDEELHYASIVFKTKNSPQKEETRDATIYSELKINQIKLEAVSRTPTGGEVEPQETRRSPSWVLWLGLGILSVLLIASVVTIIYIILQRKNRQADLTDLSAVNDQLLLQIKLLRNRTDELSSEAEELNRTLGVMMTFESFPVQDFCPEKKCQPCQRGWIHFQQKCYMFYEDNRWWKGWEASRTFCQKAVSDLVVVDNLQEQEFIGNNTKFYYDQYHGYWLGLHKSGSSWMWIDGRNDTLGFWTPGSHDPLLQYALLIPENRGSWTPARSQFLNKFICEGEALIKSN
ncbi:C-type lectin domain family 12 member B isoform X1 [Oryzias latipes]|uniref:C-type lectin domain family 12 member B isoform X1 n=1 Tax=Oryzias latipes TaxID=8090 RepID=UPI0009D9DDB9|nr:C-type lectin domain family 12 member B isoform X1 [Oryzias latipes]